MINGADNTPVPAASPIPTDWEDPPRRRARADVPVLSVEGFEGPLDWLVEMVRAHKIDLARIPILALIEAFADALAAGLAQRQDSSAAPLWRWGDWLVMAANLTLMRSRLMLPTDAGEAASARAEAEALRRRLGDRLLVDTRTDWLSRQPQLGQEMFARGEPELHGASQHGDLTDLLRACLVALRLPDDIAVYQPAPPALWSVADATARIQAILARAPLERRLLEEFLPPFTSDTPDRALHQRAALASTLVAGLELARAGALILQQEATFGPVQLAVTADPIPA